MKYCQNKEDITNLNIISHYLGEPIFKEVNYLLPKLFHVIKMRKKSLIIKELLYGRVQRSCRVEIILPPILNSHCLIFTFHSYEID